jgi:hypothetical protein
MRLNLSGPLESCKRLENCYVMPGYALIIWFTHCFVDFATPGLPGLQNFYQLIITRLLFVALIELTRPLWGFARLL